MPAQQVGLIISQRKADVIMLNVPNPSPVKVNVEDRPTTEQFSYLGCTVNYDGGTSSDIKNCKTRPGTP